MCGGRSGGGSLRFDELRLGLVQTALGAAVSK
jgi:hypothetical protein